MLLSEKCRKIFQDAIERYIAEQNQSLRTTEKACTPETSEQTTLSTNS
jgi:TRAP-type C4-dicarboxylate transport system substrate-binding protein